MSQEGLSDTLPQHSRLWGRAHGGRGRLPGHQRRPLLQPPRHGLRPHPTHRVPGSPRGTLRTVQPRVSALQLRADVPARLASGFWRALGHDVIGGEPLRRFIAGRQPFSAAVPVGEKSSTASSSGLVLGRDGGDRDAPLLQPRLGPSQQLSRWISSLPCSCL